MFETIRQFWVRLGVDVARLLVILVGVLGLNQLDALFQFSEQYSYLTSLISSTSIVILVAAISHITRRILFPDMDLKEFAKSALSHPTGAGLVFLSVCLVLTALIVSNILLLS